MAGLSSASLRAKLRNSKRPFGWSEALSDHLDEVVVVIPALNEEVGLAEVLKRLPKVGRVVVADNGSSDRTAEVARERGATVVSEPRRGYGNACLAGLVEVYRLANRGEEPKVVAFIDADFSDSPELLPELVRPILKGSHDLVIGSRMLGDREPGAMPLQAVFGNRLACWLMKVLLGAEYTDLGPYRAISFHKLRELGMSDHDFGWTIEMQIKAHRAKLRVLETPVPYRCRVGKSKISGTISGSIRAGAKILYLIAKYGLFARRAPGPSHGNQD